MMIVAWIALLHHKIIRYVQVFPYDYFVLFLFYNKKRLIFGNRHEWLSKTFLVLAFKYERELRLYS